MKSYLTKTPALIKEIYPGYVWDMRSYSKEIYLTFDDGPHPKITPWVLDLLNQFQAKASFFCVGDNILKHPETFQKIIEAGHAIGNHTFNHLNGWTTRTNQYLENVEKTEQRIDSFFVEQKGKSEKRLENIVRNSKLFRPPYGKIRKKQAKYLLENKFKIIMWDVLSGDFDTKISPEKCYKNSINRTQMGSIIVFHDSEKAFDRLEYSLPKTLEYFSRNGYKFKALS